MPTDAVKAYRLIKEKIISLEFPPGSVIQDMDLTEQLGLGRTPIREALKLLEAEKLVITVPRRGIFVSSVSITDLQQIVEIRLEMEGLAARLAAQRAGPRELDELDQLAEKVHAVEANSSWSTQERLSLDKELHLAVAQVSRNPFLVTEVERFYDLAMRLWHLALERVRPQEVNLGSHLALIEAVRAGDADRAEAIAREHILEFQRTVKEAI